MEWVYDDGGRAEAGFKGFTGDCVTRSIAIATQTPYEVVYKAINGAAKAERLRTGRKRSSARTGVKKQTIRRYLDSIGWKWTPTMHVGQGCTTHLRKEELPPGRLIVSVSGHLTCVIDGVVHDTFNPGREGTRCVYGYWRKEE
jgi:hypothetical protein